MATRATFSELVDAVARLRSAPSAPSEADRRAVSDALVALGVEQVFDDLDLAERIILAGEGFHSIERFFVDGSAEQRFVAGLVRRVAARPSE